MTSILSLVSDKNLPLVWRSDRRF